MSISLLGTEYRLVTQITEDEITRVLLVEAPDGQKVILKLHADPDLFFDELARYYACGDSDYFGRVLYNIPPYAVSGNPMVFGETFLRLYGQESLIGRELSSFEMSSSRMANVGILVLEWFKGVPLLEAAGTFSPEQRLFYMGELLNAVRIMHESGEFHGKLIPSNVLVDHQNESIRLLGLDFFPGKTTGERHYLSPEHLEETDSVGPRSDIYMLANNFIDHMDLPEKNRVDALVRECSKKPESRPSIDIVARKLGLGPETTILDRLFSHPGRISGMMKLASVTCLILVSVIGITVSREDPFFEQKARYLDVMESNPDEAVDGLVEMRSDWLEKQDILAEAIAEARMARADYRVTQMTSDEISSPIAVFNFRQRAMIFWDKHALEIGDWIRLDGDDAYISEIKASQVTLTRGQETRVVSFMRPGFQLMQSLEDSGVLIWKREGNLSRLMDGLRILPGLMDEEASIMSRHKVFSDLLRQPGERVSVTNESVYGFYKAETLTEFISLLEPQLQITPREHGLIVAGASDHLPVHLSFDYLNIPNSSVDQICRLLSEGTGFRFFAGGDCGDHKVTARFFDKNWTHIIEEMGLRWEVVDSAGEKAVSISCLD